MYHSKREEGNRKNTRKKERVRSRSARKHKRPRTGWHYLWPGSYFGCEPSLTKPFLSFSSPAAVKQERCLFVFLNCERVTVPSENSTSLSGAKQNGESDWKRSKNSEQGQRAHGETRIQACCLSKAWVFSCTEELETGNINLYLYYIFMCSLDLMIKSILHLTSGLIQVNIRSLPAWTQLPTDRKGRLWA